MSSMRKVLVTPEIAREWLQRVGRQRTLRKAGVITYATDMAEGRWQEDISPIVFDTNGYLVNGQHRLHAVVLSGVSTPFWVMEGVAPDAMSAMDMGLVRRASDQLAIDGLANGVAVASVARKVLCYEQIPHLVWASSTAATITKTLIMEEVLTDPDSYQRAVSFGYAARRTGSASESPWGVLALLVGRYSSNPDLWPEFHTGVTTGVNLSAEDPRLALRQYHVRSKETRGWGSGQSNLLAYIKAWNKYVDEEPTRLLKAPRREELPMPKLK